jgi:uncharacterized protein YgbK (DUF1537 family)
MIGVIADDTTGANDIGVMFAKHGWTTVVVAHDAPDPLPPADVTILDTDSRLDGAETAYGKVANAARRLQALGCTWLHKKTCSVFRGNIGVEFDAMLDVTGETFAIVSVAFPKNGRETRQGVHTVHGRRLEESAFAGDPVHPTRESDLVSILGKQTRRPVRLVPLEVVRSGAATLRRRLVGEAGRGGYAIVDAIEQRDLAILAEAAHDFRCFAGSSAIAEELPRFWPQPPGRDLFGGGWREDPNGVLVVAGSLTPQTRAQTDALSAAKVATFVLDARVVFEPVNREREMERIVGPAAGVLRRGADVLVLADSAAEAVAETQRRGAEHGLDRQAASKQVSAALAELTERIVRVTGLTRLVIAGGDTSGTICRRLGICGNYVLEEVATGVPSGRAIGRDMVLVLKSGSFGEPEFLIRATEHLKTPVRTRRRSA